MILNWIIAGVIFIIGGCGSWQMNAFLASSINVDGSEGMAADIEEMIAPYKEGMDSLMNEVLVTNKETLTLEQPESNLGNHVVDIIFSVANEAVDEEIDFAIMNVGGIRKEVLPEGELTLGDAYELIPFDNEIVILTLDYDLMKLLFQYMTYMDGWPLTGATYEIERGLPKNIKINGKPLLKGQTYRVAMSEYIANGGDKFNFLKLLKRERTNVLVRDALIYSWKHLNKQNLNVTAEKVGRVIKK